MTPAEEAKAYAIEHGYRIEANGRRYDVFRTGEAVEIANVGGYPAALNAMKRDVEARTEETAIMNNPADVRMQCPKTGELATRADDPFEPKKIHCDVVREHGYRIEVNGRRYDVWYGVRPAGWCVMFNGEEASVLYPSRDRALLELRRAFNAARGEWLRKQHWTIEYRRGAA